MFTPLTPNFPFYHEETQSSAYDVERQVFRDRAREITFQKGVQCQYYVTTTTAGGRNDILGEDTNRMVVRKFTLQTYFILPQEDFYTNVPQGMEFLNDFRIQTEMAHFSEVSKYNDTMTSAIYPPMPSPKAGDLIYSGFNKTFYEILAVKQNDGQFLKTQNLWSMYVREMVDEKLLTTDLISAGDVINSYNNIPDTFNISAAVEEIFREEIQYDPSETETPPPENTNFGGGW